MGQPLVTVTIDGQQAQVERDTTALVAAQQLGIRIPTLCYHPALPSYGACRLCVVEIKRGSRSRLSTSCNFPIREDGLVIETRSPRVMRNRRMVMELLLARCPNVKVIQDLASEMGVKGPRFPQRNDDCVLCGLCVRVCEEVIGVSAISFVGRGPERTVLPPFNEPSEACIACGACAYICPTGAIKIEDVAGKRVITRWNTELARRPCSICGTHFAPVVTLEVLANRGEFLKETLELCPKCRREVAITRWITGTRTPTPSLKP